jgi:L-asparaginase/beta-aspartyl-peptidase (threonine type)
MSKPVAAMALHGGAGARRHRDYTREIAHMRGLIEAGRDRLRSGASAVDVAVETLCALEASGLYVAGRGASPNSEGRFELDASLMDGAARDAGAVAALEGFQSPISVARAVMMQTPHVMLVGEGARLFAKAQGLAEIADPQTWFTPTGLDEANHAPGQGPSVLAHGTVGCVVRDLEGRLAGGTSTGGVFNKMPGRVGDTPIIGAGTWADDQVAVSCTGQGEFFIRVAAAAQVGFRLRLARQGLTCQSLAEATRAVMDEIAGMGGDGGLISVDAAGVIAMPFASEGMKRAALHADGRIEAEAF